MAISLYAPIEMQRELAGRAKNARLTQEFTQAGLAKRAGVSLGSLKRFEQTGHISLESILKIALVLGHLEDFLKVFSIKDKSVSLDEIIKRSKKRQRGSHS